MGLFMDLLKFREALGKFATGICLVTAEDPSLGSMAITVNSFASVSLDPALVLWSIQNTSEHANLFTKSPHFGISILSDQQQEISAQYAKKGHHSVSPNQFSKGAYGEPKLVDAIAHFSCMLHAVYPGGDHQIIVGEVREFACFEEAPLIFYEGKYQRLSKT